jgi:catechol 2,3-dioxygenase-like lactoylglutathione lyase family enzyme
MATTDNPDSGPLVTEVAVVALYVQDLERSLAFYRDLLGLTVLQPMEPGVLLKAGAVTLYMEGGRQPVASPGLDSCALSLCLGGPSIRRIWQQLVERGVPVVEPWLQHGPDFAMFRVEDPDGLVVEFAGKP